MPNSQPPTAPTGAPTLHGLADDLIAQAEQHAARAADQAAQSYRAAAGDQYSAEMEKFRRRQVWVSTLIETLSVAERQLAAIGEAIRDDIDQLDTGLARDRQLATIREVIRYDIDQLDTGLSRDQQA